MNLGAQQTEAHSTIIAGNLCDNFGVLLIRLPARIMLLLVSLFWNICLMREGPERVPSQQVLPGILVIGKIVLVMSIGAALGRDPTVLGVTTSVALWTAALGCCVAYALFLGNKMHRFSPTFGAILGIDLLLSIVFGVALVVLHMLNVQISEPVSIVYQLWHMAIIGFIMHRALDITLGIGIGVGLIISIFCVSITQVVTQ